MMVTPEEEQEKENHNVYFLFLCKSKSLMNFDGKPTV
jgi:hypothetical protein